MSSSVEPERYFPAPGIAPCEPISLVYTSVDARVGPRRSKFTNSWPAIVSFYLKNSDVVICGFEYFGSVNTYHETNELLHGHISAIRAHPCFSGAQIVLIIESNIRHESQIIANQAVKIQNLTILCDSDVEPDHPYGVYSNKTLMEDYDHNIYELKMTNKMFKHSPIVWNNSFPVGGDYVELAGVKFEEELYRSDACRCGIYWAQKHNQGLVSDRS